MLGSKILASSSNSGDPYWTNVVSLVRFEGANGSRTITDEVSGMSWNTMTGSSVISTARSKFGTSSLYTPASDGAHSYGNSTLALGTGDFTVEFFINPTNLAASDNWGRLIQTGPENTKGGLWVVNTSKSSPIALLIQCYNTSYFNIFSLSSAQSAIPNDLWSHIELNRASGVWRIFVNGDKKGETTNTSPGTDLTATWYGLGAGSSKTNSISAYFDSVRITKGVARHTSNFTPPTKPFPNK